MLTGALIGCALGGCYAAYETSKSEGSDAGATIRPRRSSRPRVLLVPPPASFGGASKTKGGSLRRSSLAGLARLSLSKGGPPRRASVRPPGLSDSEKGLSAADLKTKRSLRAFGSRAFAVMDHAGNGFVECSSMVALYGRLGSDTFEAQEAWEELIRDAIGVDADDKVEAQRLTRSQWSEYVNRLVLSATTPGEIFDLHEELKSIVGDLRRASILGRLQLQSSASSGRKGSAQLADELRRRAASLSSKIAEEVIPLAERFFETIDERVEEEEGASCAESSLEGGVGSGRGRGSAALDAGLLTRARKMSKMDFLDSIERQADECTSEADVVALEVRLRGRA